MTIVLSLIAILLTLAGVLLMITAGLFALSVVLSFAISWYERVNHQPDGDTQHRYALATRLMITEFISLLLTLLLRPLGWLPTRIPTGPSRRPPIILLHGLFQNRSCMFLLQWRLRAAGFDRIITVNTPPWLDLDTLTDKVRQRIEQLRNATGAEQVHLVGHSMGGIIARNFIQVCDGAPQVANCVTLGAPHRGSKLAPFAVSRLGRALLPGSGLITRLAAAPLPATVRFTSIYTRHDNIIVPMENARLEGAENIELTGIGHTAMLFSPRAAKAVATALKSGAGN